MNNIVKTTILLTALTLLLLLFGSAIGGRSGMVTAFVFAAVMNFSAYWFSDRIVLSMYRAQPIVPDDAPELYRIVSTLAARADIPMPKLYLIPSEAPNAFATGRSPRHAAIAVTKGIVELLNEEELSGVLAHELSHVIHRDTLISTLAATMAGAISMLASMVRWAFMFGGSRSSGNRDSNPVAMLFAALIMPLAALLIQMAVSRSREYHADSEGAKLCGNPLYLSSALRKLDSGIKRHVLHQADPSTVHLLILNPLQGRGLESLFSTHPPLEDRIVRLEAMAL